MSDENKEVKAEEESFLERNIRLNKEKKDKEAAERLRKNKQVLDAYKIKHGNKNA